MASTKPTFQQRMKDARTKAGLSYSEAAYAIREYLAPAQHVSYDTIRRVEHMDETKADPILVWALALAYGVDLWSLSPIAAEWMTENQSRFVMSKRGKRQSPCIGVTAGSHPPRENRVPNRPVLVKN